MAKLFNNINYIWANKEWYLKENEQLYQDKVFNNKKLRRYARYKSYTAYK